MNCLYCGKEITKDEDKKNNWHNKCIKNFFGTKTLPILDLSKETLEQLAIQNTNKGLTIPGVQKKLSLYLTDDVNPRLTLNYPTGYILKPQTEEYELLPEIEHLIMMMAKKSGIQVVPFALIKMNHSKNFSYITKRIDRSSSKKLAMEDFCQLEERLTEDKYKASYESCAKIILKYSIHPGIDLAEFFLRILFSFVVGNSDMHLKNFSLIETGIEANHYYLSPAYDFLSTAIVIPEDTEQLALTFNGKKKNIKKEDFLLFAKTIHIPENSAVKMIKKIISMENTYVEMCKNSFLSMKQKENLINLIKDQIQILKQ